MRRVLALLIAAGSAVGCGGRQAPPIAAAPSLSPSDSPASQDTAASPVATTPEVAVAAQQPPIAVIDDIEISRDKVVDMLIASSGLDMLLRVVQVELAEALAEKEGLKATDEDVAAETERTTFLMAKEANQDLLDKIQDAELKQDQALAEKLREQFNSDAKLILQQALARERMTTAEFELLMRTNANLRKVVEKQIEGKITEENLREAFLNLYGENVRIRHIQLANIAEVAEAQARLRDGVPFQQVARQMSRNAATRATGGELLPFSRETQGLPDVFKEVAFSLKNPGDVSDPVEANGSYHLLQLIEKISPKAIKFEDVRDSVHQQLHDRWVTERMKLLREQLARKAMTSLDIKDPVLRQQFRDRITQRENQIKERDQIARELARQRELQNRELLGATDEPDAAGDTDTPATAEGELRPPATRSGLDTPDQTPTTSPAEQ